MAIMKWGSFFGGGWGGGEFGDNWQRYISSMMGRTIKADSTVTTTIDLRAIVPIPNWQIIIT